MSRQTDSAGVAPAAAAEQAVETETIRLLHNRGSCRSFKPDPVPDALVDAVVEAGRCSPTSSNMQAYSIIVVRDPATKERLAELGGNQAHIRECPVYFALCADLTRAEAACAQHGTEFIGHTLEKGLVSSIDAALVGMSMSLVAESLGMGTVMIGAMRNKPAEVAETLGLPPQVYVVFGLCMGWPVEQPLPKPRLPAEAVVHQERYDASTRQRAMAAYDATLAQWYRAQQRETPDAAWSAVIAQKFSQPLRKDLRPVLNRLGFGLE